MLVANNTPDFLTIWKSFSPKKKTLLKQEFVKMAGKPNEPVSDMTFFRKKQKGDWTEFERDWWAFKLEMPKEILFPPKWMNQGELSEKVKNQLIG